MSSGLEAGRIFAVAEFEVHEQDLVSKSEQVNEELRGSSSLWEVESTERLAFVMSEVGIIARKEGLTFHNLRNA